MSTTPRARKRRKTFHFLHYHYATRPRCRELDIRLRRPPRVSLLDGCRTRDFQDGTETDLGGRGFRGPRLRKVLKAPQGFELSRIEEEILKRVEQYAVVVTNVSRY